MDTNQLLKKKRLTGFIFTAFIIVCCFSTAAFGQSAHVNPWAPTELGELPPVASLINGVWLKGELRTFAP